MVIVLITGPPGTGKSTLSDTAAEQLVAPVLAWDWVMAGLTGFADVQATLAAMDPDRYRAVGWSIMWNLATAHVRRGSPVVLDGVARDAEVDQTRNLAARLGTAAIVVETRSSDVFIHRSRVEGRTRDIPGWHELEWQHVERVLHAWREPTSVDLSLDAVPPRLTTSAASAPSSPPPPNSGPDAKRRSVRRVQAVAP